MSEVDSTENNVAMDEVAEKRPAAQKKGYLGTIIFLVFIVGIAGAAWYFQSMWLPQVQETYQQARTKVNDFISPKKVDPMAAPAMGDIDETNIKKTPDYVVSAIPDPVEPIAEPVDEEVPVVPAVPVEDVAAVTDDSDTSSTNAEKDETVKVESKEAAEVQTESVAQATFIDENTATTTESVMPKADKNADAMVSTEAAKDNSKPMVSTEAVQDKFSVEDKLVSKTDVVADLAAARQAFWQRDLPKAEALYKQQIENAAATADSWGELGNIYYLQAKWQQAASAYAEAALLLLDKGDFPQAMFMRYIVVGLDPAQAKRIDERVRELQAPVNG